MSTEFLKTVLGELGLVSDRMFDAGLNTKTQAFLATPYTDLDLERFSRNLLDTIVHIGGAAEIVVLTLDRGLQVAFGEEDPIIQEARREKLHAD
jgi:hypothetical protein